MGDDVREGALRLLRDYGSVTSSTQIHNAVIDLRRNARHGDEGILYPLLEHSDAMVVSATLYTLFVVHDQKKKLRDLVERLAGGDSRDDMAMPIQTTAITLLAKLGKEDARAVARIREVAESVSSNEYAAGTAWLKLAELYNVEWLGSYSDELMMNPDSEASEQIRGTIRKALHN